MELKPTKHQNNRIMIQKKPIETQFELAWAPHSLIDSDGAVPSQRLNFKKNPI